MSQKKTTPLPAEAIEASLNVLDTTLGGLTGFAFVDRAFKYVRVNERYAKIANRPEDEHIGRFIDDVHDPVQSSVIRPVIERVLNGEQLIRLILPGGPDQPSDYEFSCFRFPPGDGEVQGCSILASPADSEGRAGKLREESRQRFKSLYDYHPHAIFSVDLLGNFVDANPACEIISGYTVDELIGNPFVPMVTPEDLERTFQHFSLAAQGTAQNYEIEFFHKRGDRVPIHVTNVPIIVDESIVGVYGIVEDISARKRVEREREMLHALTARRARELETEYRKEHRIAEALQRSLLVKPPRLFHDTLEVETVYRAALAEAEVGGDYFDAIPVGKKSVAVIIGDVSGKGLDAASHTAEIKFTLRAYLRDNPDPAAALAKLNALLCDPYRNTSFSDFYFVCAAVAVIDTVTGIAEVAVSGAEKPVILRAGGIVEQAAASGLPLGVDNPTLYTAVTTTLHKGDILLMVTDGITEVRRERKGEFLGSGGLIEIMKRAVVNAALPAIGSSIVREIEQFAQNGLHDDMCMLLARLI